MAKKRRTRKQKQKAKHTFKKHSEAAIVESSPENPVKGQFKFSLKSNSSGMRQSKSAKPKAKVDAVPNMGKDIIKSLLVTSFVLSLELMIYLIWR
jgi:hypothetical protein